MTIRFGMIGSGQMARIHATALAADPDLTRLVAVAGGSRATAFAQTVGAEAEPTVDDLLARADVDAVVIATPHSAHVGQVIDAAAAGKHILLEKPMALDVDECRRMIDACRNARVSLSLAKITRWLEAVLVARDLVDSGAIGSVIAVHAHRLFAGYPNSGWPLDPKEGGAWLDWGSHGCDIVRWFAGAEPTHVVARAASRRDDLRDLTVMATFEFPDGVLANLWMSYEIPAFSATERARYTVVGTEAVLDVNAYGGVDMCRGDSIEPAYRDERFVGPNTTWEEDAPYFRRAFAMQVQDLAVAIRDGHAPSITGADGLAAVAMAVGARRSWETNAVVELTDLVGAASGPGRAVPYGPSTQERSAADAVDRT